MIPSDQWTMFALLLNSAAAKYPEGDATWLALKSVAVSAEGISDMLIINSQQESMEEGIHD